MICKQKIPLRQAQIFISTRTLVPSPLWHFLYQIFSISFCSQQKFQHGFQKNGNSHTLQQKCKPHLYCLRIQCQDYTKCNTETNTMAARGHKTYMCHRKPKTGHILDWKANEPHMSWNIYDHIYFLMLIFLYAEFFSKLCPNHTSKQAWWLILLPVSMTDLLCFNDWYLNPFTIENIQLKPLSLLAFA